MTFVLAQVSDTHLGAGTQLFRANFDRVVAALQGLRPDVLVHTGDASLDGADREADLAFAAAAHARLPGPVLCVPGNHDVGDHPERAPRQPVDDARLDRFRRHLGRDRWMLDRDGWRLLGLNSQVMGAHPEAEAQAAMIADALDTLGDRRLAVFIHKPFFAAEPDEESFDYWSVPPLARSPLHPVMAHPALRLVASGHLHLHREVTRGRVRYAWTPSVAFIVDPSEQEGLPGARPCGFLVHEFGDDGVDTSLVVPDGMERPCIHEVRAEAYPG
jgi:alkaline phosphatase D